MTEQTNPAPRRTRRRTDPVPSADPLAPESTAASAATVAPFDDAPASAAPGLPDVKAPGPAVEVRTGEGLDAATVSHLTLERGGIGAATADRVEVRLGGIGRLDAEDVYVQLGGIGAGRATSMSVELGSIGAAAAGELRVTQGIASNVIAREATIEQSLVRTLLARHVTISRPSGVLVLIAARVEGDVRTLIDWRGAFAAGLGFGLVSVLVRAVRRGR
jgi:hypothetical protein